MGDGSVHLKRPSASTHTALLVEHQNSLHGAAAGAGTPALQHQASSSHPRHLHNNTNQGLTLEVAASAGKRNTMATFASSGNNGDADVAHVGHVVLSPGGSPLAHLEQLSHPASPTAALGHQVGASKMPPPSAGAAEEKRPLHERRSTGSHSAAGRRHRRTKSLPQCPPSPFAAPQVQRQVVPPEPVRADQRSRPGSSSSRAPPAPTSNNNKAPRTQPAPATRPPSNNHTHLNLRDDNGNAAAPGGIRSFLHAVGGRLRPSSAAAGPATQVHASSPSSAYASTADVDSRTNLAGASPLHGVSGASTPPPPHRGSHVATTKAAADAAAAPAGPKHHHISPAHQHSAFTQAVHAKLRQQQEAEETEELARALVAKAPPRNLQRLSAVITATAATKAGAAHPRTSLVVTSASKATAAHVAKGGVPAAAVKWVDGGGTASGEVLAKALSTQEDEEDERHAREAGRAWWRALLCGCAA